MRPTHTPFLLTLLGSCILFPLSSPAPLTAYMKIDDIEGESQDANHDKWIDILSISSGIRQIMIDGQPSGTREHKPVKVTHRVDKASPLLMDVLTSGQPLPDITLEATEPVRGTGSSVTYFRYKLKDARVTSYEIVADPDGDPDRPVVGEAVFEFPYAEWHVRQFDEGGTAVIDSAGAFYDMQLNESGPATIGPVIEQVGNVELSAGETVEVDIRIEDFDTPQDGLLVEVETDSAAANVGPIKWMAPEVIRVPLTTTTAASGNAPVHVRVFDGDNIATMSFSLFIDSSGTPWDGFLMAYFDAEERADPAISSPIEDPDGDNLETLLEFLLGTNPREFTPIEFRKAAEGGGGGGGRIAVRPAILDPDDDGDGYGLSFSRRIDDPRIRLSLHASFDGGTSWTELQPESGENPLYEESANKGENPLYETVNGSVNPPVGATSVMLRFVGEME
jgi:type VI secretion system Hcp family effector